MSDLIEQYQKSGLIPCKTNLQMESEMNEECTREIDDLERANSSLQAEVDDLQELLNKAIAERDKWKLRCHELYDWFNPEYASGDAIIKHPEADAWFDELEKPT